MKRYFIICLVLFFALNVFAQRPINKLVVRADSAEQKISKFIYGHFAEHLGRCIYGGIWVGRNSKIPNIRGYRKDVLTALKAIHVPVIRWPGGCFADTYHWKEGIGPYSKRPRIVNTTWGGVVEDNSFGTHEFLEFCELLGAEPYISVNVGSGTVREASEWVEYVNSTYDIPMVKLRHKNGRLKPWNVKFWGIGNETWGCGGIMSADYYANVLSRYSFFMKNYGETKLYKIASSGLPEDFNWTEIIMKKWKNTDTWLQDYMSGYSLHYYTVIDWNKKGSAINFTEKEWFIILQKALYLDELIKKHSEIMDRYDPEKRIGLVVDEWGTWYDVEPGVNPAFLYQQNSLRDAIVAAISLNIFNNHCDRVKMANLAQLVNVLQSVIITKDEQIVLTPTYYVFKMFSVHQDATLLPTKLECEEYSYGEEKIKSLNVSASRDKDGKIHISIVNLDPNNVKELECKILGSNVEKGSAEIITAERMNAFNDFGKTEEVNIKPFEKFKLEDDRLIVSLPPKSIVMFELE
ncbi:MAG: alpha-N-arabinofuranosidase [candidate division WOR-3 bacterium]